jgi:phosphatidylinositol alpha-mannosyltransferase
MKIALVLDDTLDTPDGVQQYVLNVGSWLSGQGHEVHYLVGQTARTDIPNVHVMSRNMQVKFNGNRMSIPLPVSRRRLKTFLAEQRYDVVHVQVPYSPFMAGRLVKALPAHTPVVGTFHILPYSSLVTFGNQLLAIANRRSGKRFDRILAVTAPAGSFAHKVYGYKTEVVPNPVALAQYENVTSDDPNLNIVFLGRLVARKGALQLLQAIAYMHREQLYDGNYHVYIGGKGELAATISNFVEANELSKIVTIQGFVEEAAKPAFLSKADIAVYPSLAGESFGIVLLEGMAAGRGVVLAGNNPGYASVMQPYPDQLFDPRDTRAFAELLAWHLAHPEARGRAADLQHGYVQRFDIGVVGARLVSIYTHLLQTKART